MKTMEWRPGELHLIDQRKLPVVEEVVVCRTYSEVARAIKDMIVRGAPAIGAAAAYGVALAMYQFVEEERDRSELPEYLKEVRETLAQTRPTAVNLFWALDRMNRLYQANRDLKPEQLKERLEEEAKAIADEDVATNRKIGEYGAALVPEKAGILTHCNAGALATVDYGTALAVIRVAHEQGKDIHVYADETRPFLQGARLTAWELQQDGIPVTLITDNMAAYAMQQGLVDLVITGADRIAANGDTANKIGTYGVAILAKEHGIPFYVAAPRSTIDASLATGEEIPIEERHHSEVTHVFGTQVAPTGIDVINPAFDVTPHRYIAGIITEVGVLKPPFTESIAEALKK
ncbi:MAG: S-methyl-5-thioribose-1-phosphate isomerase [Firmicutes bacterium]|nr:S-methyl-5-thioribose-1-phosphate isomerase [Bacillota bacterium]